MLGCPSTIGRIVGRSPRKSEQLHRSYRAGILHSYHRRWSIAFVQASKSIGLPTLHDHIGLFLKNHKSGGLPDAYGSLRVMATCTHEPHEPEPVRQIRDHRFQWKGIRQRKYTAIILPNRGRVLNPRVGLSGGGTVSQFNCDNLKVLTHNPSPELNNEETQFERRQQSGANPGGQYRARPRHRMIRAKMQQPDILEFRRALLDTTRADQYKE